MGRRYADLIVLSLIVLASGFLGYRVVNFNIPPFEDAAMLMRYAAHFSQGYGIVWNIGDPPLDGATDFLFMIVVGLVNAAGVSLEMATRGIALFSHFLTIILIYAGIRYTYNSGIVSAALSTLFFAVGPGLFLCAAYFGTSFFVLFICATWLIALKIMFVSYSRSTLIFFSLMSLATGLIRPEGVLIAVFMLVAIVLKIGFREARTLLIYFAVTFAVIGGAFFAWRWDYFGHPLPNPFYKKGGGSLYFESLFYSIDNTFGLCFPFLPIFFLGLRSKKLLRLTAVFSVPILGSMGMWVLLSSEMNFGARFQYPIMPIVLMCWYPFVINLRKDLKLPKLSDFSFQARLAVVVTAIVVLMGAFEYRVRKSRRITYAHDGRYDVALMLGQYSDRGYTIATTEAGLLPLYSKWRAIDTWGLNDSWIAHNGGITQEYLKNNRPDIIAWHGYFSPVATWSESRTKSRWFQMVFELKTFAEANNYVLAASYGRSPYDTHYYYCSRDIPECDEIVSMIRNMKYKWFRDGRPSMNYALFANHPTVDSTSSNNSDSW